MVWGIRDTTCRGLMFAEFDRQWMRRCCSDPDRRSTSARGPWARRNETALPCDCRVLCLLVTALRESHQAADRAVLQTYLRHLGLAWGVTS